MLRIAGKQIVLHERKSRTEEKSTQASEHFFLSGIERHTRQSTKQSSTRITRTLAYSRVIKKVDKSTATNLSPEELKQVLTEPVFQADFDYLTNASKRLFSLSKAFTCMAQLTNGYTLCASSTELSLWDFDKKEKLWEGPMQNCLHIDVHTEGRALILADTRKGTEAFIFDSKDRVYPLISLGSAQEVRVYDEKHFAVMRQMKDPDGSSLVRKFLNICNIDSHHVALKTVYYESVDRMDWQDYLFADGDVLSCKDGVGFQFTHVSEKGVFTNTLPITSTGLSGIALGNGWFYIQELSTNSSGLWNGFESEKLEVVQCLLKPSHQYLSFGCNVLGSNIILMGVANKADYFAEVWVFDVVKRTKTNVSITTAKGEQEPLRAVIHSFDQLPNGDVRLCITRPNQAKSEVIVLSLPYLQELQKKPISTQVQTILDPIVPRYPQIEPTEKRMMEHHGFLRKLHYSIASCESGLPQPSARESVARCRL